MDELEYFNQQEASQSAEVDRETSRMNKLHLKKDLCEYSDDPLFITSI